MGKITSAAATAALLITLFAAPGPALAETYTVDSTADEPDQTLGSPAGPDACETAGNVCTLRAAIEESNDSEATDDNITFDGSIFNGQLADTIALGASFPKITDRVSIFGGSPCLTAPGVNGPCVGVSGPSGGFGLWVENTDNVTIIGLAVTGALTGINVTGSSNAFSAAGNWLGVKLDGSPGANSVGMFLDPDSDGVVIGGAATNERNVFANNSNIGLDLEGASNANIRGNFFGVAPDGVTQAANPKNIEITDSTAAPGFEATGNVVGAQLSPADAASFICDGGCNLISGATFLGIDLRGDGGNEAPASGASIRGNHIGLDAAGTGAIPNGSASVMGSGGIAIGGADDVVIGGPSAGYINHLNGGPAAVQAGPAADDLVVEGNMIGLNHSGVAMFSPPTQEGIAVDAQGISVNGQATITHNRISMGGGTAIIHENGEATGATIADNVIGRSVTGQGLLGANFGIYLTADLPGTGHTIKDNVVENAKFTGIAVEAAKNVVKGNEVAGAGESGIVIQGVNGVENTIGGNTAAEENTISGTEGNAIEVGPAGIDNQILRNTGSANIGLFIDLGQNGPGNVAVNGGIQPPVITAATPGGVSGTADPEAIVRVFEKATGAPGEIKAFLGQAEADASGNWAFSYGTPLPEGTHIGLTQTGPEGTSELALATAATPPVSPPPSGGGGGGGGGAFADRTPPQTMIGKGPKARSASRTAKFRFTSSESGSRFQCKLERKPFKPCRSPKTYRGLKPGKHVFRVRATDAAGNTDPSPAKRVFRVTG